MAHYLDANSRLVHNSPFKYYNFETTLCGQKYIDREDKLNDERAGGLLGWYSPRHLTPASEKYLCPLCKVAVESGLGKAFDEISWVGSPKFEVK